MTPPDTFKDKAALSSIILCALRSAQNLDAFEMESAIRQAMEAYESEMDCEDTELTRYRIVWDERHLAYLLAASEDDAMKAAARIRPECFTRQESGNWQVEVLEGDGNV